MNIKYHDEEWGVPVRDDKKHFEFLILEGAQAGLSWLTILKRRHGYKRVFYDFDPLKVVQMTEKEIQSALMDSGIIRNKLKVRSAVNNAKVFLDIQNEFGSFSDYIWSFVAGEVIKNNWKDINQIPTTSTESDLLSKDLKKRGMSFVGSTIMYAHMQATGLINDHIVGCFRYNSIN
jgi:DNA-3-methyladenine glycosylase I